MQNLPAWSFFICISLIGFVKHTLFSYPKECCELLDKGAFDKPCFEDDLKVVTDSYIVTGLSDFEFKKRLRILRRTRAMVIAWRDSLAWLLLKRMGGFGYL